MNLTLIKNISVQIQNQWKFLMSKIIATSFRHYFKTKEILQAIMPHCWNHAKNESIYTMMFSDLAILSSKPLLLSTHIEQGSFQKRHISYPQFLYFSYCT